jgi:hypothetical protein
MDSPCIRRSLRVLYNGDAVCFLETEMNIYNINPIRKEQEQKTNFAIFYFKLGLNIQARNNSVNRKC